MKNLSIAIVALIVVGLAFGSCKKGEIYGDYKTLTVGAYLTLLGTGNSTLDYKGIDTSTVSITVGGYGSPIETVNLYCVLGANLDASTWKFIKALPFSEGMELKVTGAELVSALGISAEDVNTDISIYPEAVTTDGRKFSIANTPTSYSSFPAYHMAFIWKATLINYVCPYDQAYFDGTFNVVTDEWADFSTGDGILVSPGPGANQISITLYPSPAFGSNRTPIIADVDPETDSITVAKQTYGDYGGTKIAAEGTGFLSACSGIISLTLTHTDADSGDDYGTYQVVLQKP